MTSRFYRSWNADGPKRRANDRAIKNMGSRIWRQESPWQTRELASYWVRHNALRFPRSEAALIRWRTLTLAGLLLYLPAFLLPAAKPVTSGPGSGSMVGWLCAAVSTMAIGSFFKSGVDFKNLSGICLALSGLVNPLLLAYLLFSIRAKFVKTRVSLTIAILLCIAATWGFFRIDGFQPLVGHYLWIAGIALMLLADLWKRDSKVAKATFPADPG